MVDRTIPSMTKRQSQTTPYQPMNLPRPDRRMLRQVLEHNEAINRAVYESAPITTSTRAASYDDMLLDATVAACIESITGAVLADPFYINPADRHDARALMIADEIEQNLRDLPTETILETALETALCFGFAPAEISWRYHKQHFCLDSVADLDRDQMALDLDSRMNVLRYRSQPTAAEEKTVEREKLWFHTHRASRKHPAGRSILDAAYRPWNAKDNYLRFYGLTLQRYGFPLMILTLPSTADSNMQSDALAAAYALRLDGVAVFPNGVSYVIEQPPQWHGLDFEAAIKLMDSYIIRRMLLAISSTGGSGQTYITGEGLLQQARSTAYLLARVSRQLCESFTDQVIRPLVYANYGERPDLVPSLALPPPGESNLPDVASPLTDLVNAGILSRRQAAQTAGFEFDEEAEQEQQERDQAEQKKAEAKSNG